jgi:hypothetical protein
MFINRTTIKSAEYLMEYHQLPDNIYKSKLMSRGTVPVNWANNRILKKDDYINMLDGIFQGQQVPLKKRYEIMPKINDDDPTIYKLDAQNQRIPYYEHRYGQDITMGLPKSISCAIALLPAEQRHEALDLFMRESEKSMGQLLDDVLDIKDKNGNKLYKTVFSSSFLHIDSRPSDITQNNAIQWYLDSNNKAKINPTLLDIANNKNFQSFQVHSHNVLYNMALNQNNELVTIDTWDKFHFDQKFNIGEQLELKLMQIYKQKYGMDFYLDKDMSVQVVGINKLTVDFFSMRNNEVNRQANETGLTKQDVAQNMKQGKPKDFSFKNHSYKSHENIQAINEYMQLIENDTTKFKYSPELFLDYFDQKMKTFTLSQLEHRLRKICFIDPSIKYDVELANLKANIIDLGNDEYITTLKYKYVQNDLLLRNDILKTVNNKFIVYNQNALNEIQKIMGTNNLDFKLTDEQKNVIKTISQSVSQVNVLNAGAGTGKTTSLQALFDLHQKAGFKVIGASYQHSSVAQIDSTLLNGNKLPTYTVSQIIATSDMLQKSARLSTSQRDLKINKHISKNGLQRSDVDNIGQILQGKVFLAIDEASLLPARLYSQISYLISKNPNLKTLYLGDTGQLNSLDGLMLFQQYANDKRIPNSKLTESFRQQNIDDKKITNELNQTDDSTKALLALQKTGKVSLFKDKQSAVAATINSYVKDSADVIDKSIIASTNDNIYTLNKAIQSDINGKKHNKAEIFISYTKKMNDNFVKLYVGDRVVFERDNKQKGYKKGTVGIITSMRKNSIDDYQVTVKTKDEIITIDSDKKIPLALGYALSSYKMQGAKDKSVHILKNSFTSKEMEKVEITRHSNNVHIYSTYADFDNIKKRNSAITVVNDSLEVQKINDTELKLNQQKNIIDKINKKNKENEIFDPLERKMYTDINRNKIMPIIKKPIKTFTLPEIYEKSKTLRGL